MKRRRRLLIVLLSLVVLLIGLPVWLIVRETYQQRLNHLLIEAIRNHDANVGISLLNRGADPDTYDLPSDDRPFWRQVLDRLQGRVGPTSDASSALWIALLS